MTVSQTKAISSNTQRELGITMVELMFALVILATGLGALSVLFATAIKTNNKNARDTSATMLAQLVLEKISAQPVNSPTNFTVTDCAGNTLTIATVGAAAPAGQGAGLTATGRIDQTQVYTSLPSNYAMMYTSCGNGSRLAVYDVRWNVMTLTSQTRLITVSARQSLGTASNGALLGGLTFAMPVTLRGIGGM